MHDFKKCGKLHKILKERVLPCCMCTSNIAINSQVLNKQNVTYIHNAHLSTLKHMTGVSECNLTTSEQLFSYIMEGTSYTSMRGWWPLCSRPTSYTSMRG